MLTGKDHMAIAAILNRVEKPQVLMHVIEDMADYMAKDNPNFDRDRFIAACYKGK